MKKVIILLLLASGNYAQAESMMVDKKKADNIEAGYAQQRQNRANSIAKANQDYANAKADAQKNSNISLIGKTLSSKDLNNKNFKGANLLASIFAEQDPTQVTTVVGANFTDANLQYSSLVGASLKSISFFGADLQFAWLSWSDFTKANFARANLTNAHLDNSTFTGANFTDATLGKNTLANSVFTDATFVSTLTDKPGLGINLSGADLTNANFTGADLTNANLSESDLTGANFTNAKCTGVDFRGANLSNAKLNAQDFSTANFESATYNKQTVLGNEINSQQRSSMYRN